MAYGKKRNVFGTLEYSELSSTKYSNHCPRLLQCYHSLGIRPSRVTTYARFTATWNLSVTAVNFTVTKAYLLPKVADKFVRTDML